MEIYDIVILGGTVEGMTASVYCARKGLKILLIESELVHGENLDNLKLIHRLKREALDLGVQFSDSIVYSIWCNYAPKVIYTEKGPIGAYCLILAMGTSYTKLGVPLESTFEGCGLNYHLSCTSSYLKGRTVAVYGTSEASINHAITLSVLCKTVYLICPHSVPNCTKQKTFVLKSSANIVVLNKTLISSFRHKNRKLIGINIIDKTTGNAGSLDCEIIYVNKGIEPNSRLCFPYVLTDRYGFIITDKNLKTNLDGVYAAGPIRCSFTSEENLPYFWNDANIAATDGAIAATFAVKYICSIE